MRWQADSRGARICRANSFHAILIPKIGCIDARWCIAKNEILNTGVSIVNNRSNYFAAQTKFHNMKLNIAI